VPAGRRAGRLGTCPCRVPATRVPYPRHNGGPAPGYPHTLQKQDVEVQLQHKSRLRMQRLHKLPPRLA